MFSGDAIIIEIVTHNYLTLSILYAGLRYIAKETKWTGDDTIFGMVAEMGKAFQARKNGDIGAKEVPKEIS